MEVYVVHLDRAGHPSGYRDHYAPGPERPEEDGNDVPDPARFQASIAIVAPDRKYLSCRPNTE
ncbi:hypothetical protein Sru01_25680 [Sphaerisporangium rufum]|uniref:Uncharacterized protein n=1 Tax=Sphaerisporangium rufum TaxID=1381558 RepID=A0A919R0M2_9ACTN|nr:hypothetical protein Sru01_25680 [Sphaerisporangium rufum]